MVENDSKTLMNIAIIVEINLLNRYTRPKEITFDRCNKFKTYSINIIQEEFNLKVRQASTTNPQEKSILEKINQVMGNMINVF